MQLKSLRQHTKVNKVPTLNTVKVQESEFCSHTYKVLDKRISAKFGVKF